MLARDPKGAIAEPGLAALLGLLAANPPSVAEERALRALARGEASSGQQRMALRYTLAAGGAAANVFEPASERLSAFRAGSQALAQALATIAGVAWLTFPPGRGGAAGIEDDDDGS